MCEFTHLVNGERQWRFATCPLDTDLHDLITNGLGEATKSQPIAVQGHIVFLLEPIVIELHQHSQIVRIVCESQKPIEFGYSRWRDFFFLIRSYWKQVVSD